MTSLLAGFMGLGGPELIVLIILGVLLFGKRLPEVGRSLGKGIVEFKKGMKGLEDDIDTPNTAGAAKTETPALESAKPPQRVMTTAPKFDDSPVNVTAQPKA